MKKLLLLIALVILFASCNHPITVSKAEVDSFTVAKYGRTSDEQAHYMADSIIASDFMDTIGLYKSPVKVLKAELIKKEYSSYRDIQLTFKNISKKSISGIKFSWYGLNAFGEPADMGGITDGTGSGFTDQDIRPGAVLTLSWDISSRDGKKIKIAWPYEVVFSDGTKWVLKK